MPLIDSAIEKWRLWRTDVAKSEEHRKKICQQTHDEMRHEDCKKIAHLIWEAEGKPIGGKKRYYLKAKKRLKGIRWLFYQLHKPFISLERKIVRPIDRWVERVSIFRLFSKISPIGILAIPVIVFIFNRQQAKRQQSFQRGVISAQADVRQQQAVREYLSQITAIHLESDQGKKLRENEELQKLLEANTLSLFNELSLREDSRQDLDLDEEFNSEAWKKDRKGQVVEFLSDLGWIHSFRDKKSLVSLSKANLSVADLRVANLKGANLSVANLSGANLKGANLSVANLSGANLKGANLLFVDLEGANLLFANLSGAFLNVANLKEAFIGEANLSGADLEGANLSGANLSGANLSGADLEGANLSGAYLRGADLSDIKNISHNQIKSACDWEQAIYTDAEDKQANLQRIEAIRQNKASNPKFLYCD